MLFNIHKFFLYLFINFERKILLLLLLLLILIIIVYYLLQKTYRVPNYSRFNVLSFIIYYFSLYAFNIKYLSLSNYLNII